MLQRTAGWSPQMLAESPRPFVGGSREALLHEEKQSQRFGTRTNGTTTGGGGVLLISMFPRVYMEPATQ